MKRNFKRSEAAWNKFNKSPVKIAAPFIGMAVGAESKNAAVGQATANVLKTTIKR